jgi:hypothetical protein
MFVQRPSQIADGMCRPACMACVDDAAYTYILGIYLGDGHIAHMRRGVYRLSVGMDSVYIEVVEEVTRRLREVLPQNRVSLRRPKGCRAVYVQIYSKLLPELFPQHGPGPKHMRDVSLEPWQRAITTNHPQALIRGLIHSDGCRFIANQRRHSKVYRYPRYCFTNVSPDILRIFCEHLDLVGISWTLSSPKIVQVARREAVSRLDEFVGPKL